MPRFVLGARYVCTTCHTRGVGRRCLCRTGAALVDLARETLDAAGISLLEKREPRTVRRRDIAAHLLRSKLEWVFSALLALGSFFVVEISSPLTASTVLAALGFFATALVGTRLVVFVAALFLRIVVALLLVAVGATSLVVSKLTKRRSAVARRAFEAAVAVLSFFARGTVHRVRWPAITSGEPLRGRLVLPVCPRVAEGTVGSLRVEDAALERFEVTLESGERVGVVANAGVLRIDDAAIAGASAAPGERLFAEGERLTIGAAAVTLRGGEWRVRSSPEGEAAGFRVAPKARELVGTEEAPVELTLRAR